MKWRNQVFICLSLALTLIPAASEEAGVSVRDTWVRETPPGMTTMAGMVHASQLELAPKASLIFAPGGYHLMLLNPKRTLRAGDPVVINLEFRGGLVLRVTFEVRR